MIDGRITVISDCLYRVSAKVIVIQDHKILAVLEGNDKYSLPGGGIDHGESIPAALQRELEEEIGLQAGDVTIASTPSFVTNDGVSKGIPKLGLFYKAELHNTEGLRHAEVRYEWLDAAMLGRVRLSSNTAGARDFLVSLLG